MYASATSRATDQWRRSNFILRGRDFFPHSLTGRGTKPKPEAQRATSEGGVLGERQQTPSPPAIGSGERCKLLSWVRAEPQKLKFGAT